MWDLLEGHKNPAPLLWSWFGAVKMERKPLTYADNHRLLKYHTHSLVKPSSYFCEPLQLPPEDVEEPSQDKSRDEKMDTPSSVESTHGASGSKSRKSTKKPRKVKLSSAVAQIHPPVPNQTNIVLQNQSMNSMLNHQILSQQMVQQFNPNTPQAPISNITMLTTNNAMTNQIEVEQMGHNMGQAHMQMNQMGVNQMQHSASNMGQINSIQYQQQHQITQMNQMNSNQQNMNVNMNQINQIPQNQQWGYTQLQNQPSQGQVGPNQQFYNQAGPTITPSSAQQSKKIMNISYALIKFYFSVNQYAERPALNQSKQALSNMLRQRHPNQASPYNIQQQRMQMMQNQNRQQLQLQQRQMMFRARMGGKPMNSPGVVNTQVGNVSGMNTAMQQNSGMIQGTQHSMNSGMISQQNNNVVTMSQQNQNTMQTIQQSSVLPGPSSGGIINSVVPNMMQTIQQNQPSQVLGNNMNQQNLMQQNLNNIPSQLVQGNQNQQNMFSNQYQTMNQSYANYNNASMVVNQTNLQNQGGMINSFQQSTTAISNNPQRNSQSEFLSQQRRNQFLQQPQQTSNTSNMSSNVPPPYRSTSGKPITNSQNQQFQEMRMRQMMLKQQQAQGIHKTNQVTYCVFLQSLRAVLCYLNSNYNRF